MRHTMRSKGRLVACSLLLGSAALAMLPQVVSAHISSCRSDPIVWLSNGHKVALNVTVADSIADLNGVEYELHVPAGVTAARVVYTQGRMKHLEHFVVVPDNDANHYTDYTTVTAGFDGRATAAQMQIVNRITSATSKTVGNGVTNHTVTVDVANAG